MDHPPWGVTFSIAMVAAANSFKKMPADAMRSSHRHWLHCEVIAPSWSKTTYAPLVPEASVTILMAEFTARLRDVCTFQWGFLA